MKSSEALLRAIANVGDRISAVQFDDWLGKLFTAGFIKKEIDNGLFYYRLTETAKHLLRKKGVDV